MFELVSVTVVARFLLCLVCITDVLKVAQVVTRAVSECCECRNRQTELQLAAHFNGRKEAIASYERGEDEKKKGGGVT